MVVVEGDRPTNISVKQYLERIVNEDTDDNHDDR